MALDGILRPGTGGGGAALLRHRPVHSGPGGEVVSSSAFGIFVTAAGTPAVACSVTPGVPHMNHRDPTEERLRLATLAADGRQASEDDGPLGHGVWFGGARDDASYALAVRGRGSARVVIANRWGTPGFGSQGWPFAGRTIPQPFAQAVLDDRFAAGVSPNGSLYLLAGGANAAVLVLRPNGRERAFALDLPEPGLRLVAGMRRLLFPGRNRMLVACLGGAPDRPPDPVSLVRAFAVGASRIRPDDAWGTDGSWAAPEGFTPAELLPGPQGSLVCVGWFATGGTVAFSVVRVAGDGTGDDSAGPPQGPGLLAPWPIHAALEPDGALLAATTIAHPLSAFLPGLAELGLVSRWDEFGQPDTAFGNALGNPGVCFAEHQGYPLAVRGIAATAGGFFLACDRRADVRWSDAVSVVFAFGPTGQPAATFGDVGVVHHEEIPAELQLHEGPEAVAVGTMRVFVPQQADEFELALTRVGADGRVLWRYGTTHGLRSEPLFLNGARVPVPMPTAVVRWRGLWAIGGAAPGVGPGGLGFVTFRDQSGAPQGTTLRIDGPVASLAPLPDGTLEVVYREGSPVVIRRTTISPAFVVDPNPVVVPPGPGGLLLPDGSRVQASLNLTNLGSSYALRMWLTRTLPDGSIDPAFGGGGAAVPPISRLVMRAGFPSSARFELPGGVLPLPAGGYTAIVRLRQDFFFPPRSLPTGILATRWNADGTPYGGWSTDGVEHPDFITVTRVLVDHPARIVVVGAVGSAMAGTRTPTLLGIRVQDGAIDPAFGTQGRLSVALRGAEQRVAHAPVTRADGHVVVPVRVDDEENPRYELALIWLDVT